MTDVLILGGVSYNMMIYLDAFPRPAPQSIRASGFHETVGSTGAGKALNLRPLGMRVVLHAPLGDDQYGQSAAAYLRGAGIDLVADTDPQGTQRHVNLMDAAGRRISIFVVPGSPEPPIDLQRIEALIPQSDYVVLNISDYCRTLIPLIQRHGKPIWTDLHDYDGASEYYRDFVEAADYVFLSSDALPEYRPFMQQLIARGKRLVVCTHGAGGSTALTAAGEWIETPIVATYARRDTNGAGDAFFSGVLYGHSRGLGIRQCLRVGTVVGGLCVTSHELAHAGLSEALVAAEYERAYGEALELRGAGQHG
jgi:sugar/nucleoside kinase (ribokinase family)